MSTSTHLWFGSPERPLSGWLHQPADGLARAGVVLCPPFGVEGTNAHYTFRVLACRLADAGLSALRFDYDGTGDSAGWWDDPDRVDSWLSSIRTAIDLIRVAGPPQVIVVGMRLGATLAAAELDRGGPVDGLVLWDPCASGASFLREQKALHLLSLGGAPPTDGSVATPGFVYRSETVSELSPISIATTTSKLAEHILVLVRPERSPGRQLMDQLNARGVDWDLAEGQQELLNPLDIGEAPQDTVDRIVGWAAQHAPAEAEPVDTPSAGLGVVARGPHGEAVVEQPVRLGPVGLFGIETQTEKATDGPTLLYFNAGNVNHTGPARLWVELSRSWAIHGIRSVRFDLSGLGDSPVRDGQPWQVARSPVAFEDVDDAVHAVSPSDPSNVVLIGLCTGGYHAIEYGLQHPLRGICMLNPSLLFASYEYRTGIPPDRRRQANQSTRRWLRAVGGFLFVKVLRRRGTFLATGRWPVLLDQRLPKLPQPLWWLIYKLTIAKAPSTVFKRLRRRGIDILLVCGEGDYRDFQRGQYRLLRRLSESESFSVSLVPGLDHGVLEPEHRQQAVAVINDYLLKKVARSGLVGACHDVEERPGVLG